MTPDAFRKLALRLPEVIEGEHMGHGDYRVRGNIVATLGYPNAKFATIALTPEEQALFVKTHPGTFLPVKGGWGRKGSTSVLLKSATQKVVMSALVIAWKRKAAQLAPQGVLVSDSGS
jgi:hypothetical protein